VLKVDILCIAWISLNKAYTDCDKTLWHTAKLILCLTTLLALTFTRYHILTSLQRIFNTRLKNCRLLFSAVISEHFSKSCVIISAVAVKIWYLKKMCGFYWATLYISSLMLSSAWPLASDIQSDYPLGSAKCCLTLSNGIMSSKSIGPKPIT